MKIKMNLNENLTGKTGHVAPIVIVTQPVQSKNLNNDENKNEFK